MFENLRNQMDIFVCSFEINADGVIQRQTVQAPRMMIEHQFISLMNQAYRNAKPVMVKLSRVIDVWDSFDQKTIQRESSIVVKNSAYLKMEGK